MQDFIVSILGSANPESITNLFIYVMLGVTFLGAYFQHQGLYKNFVSSLSSTLTSLGILGTFVGIIVGLLGFDTSDIDKSIPVLLGGLKVAFISSFVGITLSIGFKVAQHFIPSTVPEVSEVDDVLTALKMIENAIADDNGRSVYGQLKLIRDESEIEQKKLQSKFDTLIDSLNLKLNEISKKIAWTEESSILTQIEILRKDSEETYDKLINKFDEFSERLSESASKQVIEALENVIKDFNNNLQEQFGENFKQLNEAVKELVVWQENHKQQISDMIVQYRESTQAITSIESAVSSIKDSTTGISKSAEQLKGIIETNQNQLDNLSQHLDAFSSIKDKAIDAMPVIEESLNTLTQEIRKATQESQEHISKMDKALAKELEDKLSDMGSALASITQKFTSDYQSLVREMQNVVSQR